MMFFATTPTSLSVNSILVTLVSVEVYFDWDLQADALAGRRLKCTWAMGIRHDTALSSFVFDNLGTILRQSVTIQERSQCNLRTVLKHSKTHKRTFQRQNSKSKQKIVCITSRNLIDYPRHFGLFLTWINMWTKLVGFFITSLPGGEITKYISLNKMSFPLGALWGLCFITWWPLSACVCMCIHNYQSWLHLLNNPPNNPIWLIHHGPVEACEWAGHHRGRLGFIGPVRSQHSHQEPRPIVSVFLYFVFWLVCDLCSL